MKKNNQFTVYCYRYIWKSKDSKDDVFNLKYVTGTEEEHKVFMSNLLNADNVKCASRIYMHEVNISLTEQHEIVKKEKK